MNPRKSRQEAGTQPNTQEMRSVYDDDPTPAGVIRETWRWFPAWAVVLFAVLLLIGGVTWAGSAFGWWLSAQNANHQAVNTQNGYSNQVTLRQEATADFTTLTSVGVQIAQASGDPSLVTELKAEQSATAAKVCAETAEITDGLPAQQAQWAAANCQNGTLSPNSPDYIAGAP